MDGPNLPHHAARPTPIWACQAFSFINSIGTAVMTNGIFFVTEHGYGFTRGRNYWLGVVLGVTYIVGALGSGRAMGFLETRLPRLSKRAILACLMGLMMAVCLIPWGALTAGLNGAWPIWLTICLYSPMTGLLWPIVESYVSGGRSGPGLRRATGQWNVVWSSAIIVAYFAMGPLLGGRELVPGDARTHAVRTIAVVAASHIAAMLVLFLGFEREPGEHLEGEHEPHPPVFVKLLRTFRMLLPMSYLLSSALGPLMPIATARLRLAGDAGLNETARLAVATSWLAARSCTFWIMQRWQGWHGRWFVAVMGGAFLISGFALTVLSTRISTGPGGLGLLIGGLAVFGIGMAGIYSAAIYYALEVGKAEVQAGGMHETLIGVGYTIGPLCGVAASAGVFANPATEGNFEGVFLAIVGVICVAVTVLVLRRILAHASRAASVGS